MFKNYPVKVTSTLTVFEILLFECRSVLSPAPRGTGSERVHNFADCLERQKQLLEAFYKKAVLKNFAIFIEAYYHKA